VAHDKDNDNDNGEDNDESLAATEIEKFMGSAFFVKVAAFIV